VLRWRGPRARLEQEGFDMPHDLVIPGGTLHDGTGAPGQTGEVAVVRGEVMRARSGRVIRSA
jgi:N-acyl-D-aspartate/D-glutamate deacylase